MQIPILGDVDLSLFSKPATDVKLYEIKDGFCGELNMNQNFEKYIEQYAGFKEGDCASQGYSK